ncbi:MAG TPA: DnaJ domain-containing protein [Verrucomicrobiae bacterium]
MNLPPGSSEEALRSAYRELVKAWHPDRFQSDADRLDEAHEMLKEINWAYDYLRATVFVNQPAMAVTEVPASAETPITASPAPPEEQIDEVDSAEKRSGMGFLWVALFLIAAGGVFYFTKTKQTARAPKAVETTAPAPAPVVTKTETPPAQQPSPPDRSILKSMVAVNKLKTAPTPDGLILSGSDMRDFLQAPHPVRPPFIFRATLKTGEADVRFYYGLGLVILNWTDNPMELRVHDFATSAITGVRRKGALSPDVWHDVVFDVQTNRLTISVDGETRFEGEGYYRNLNTAPGIGPTGGEITLKSVVIEEAAGADIADAQVQPRVLIRGDLLHTMVPVNGAQTNADLEGLTISDTESKGGAIMTQQKFHPPLVIRTRAKTDSLNLRLFYGGGMVIFNWEVNPGELRVHEPANGRATPVPGRGRILPNEWHDIVWEIGRGGMRLMLDGKIWFQCNGDYSKVDATAGIGEYLSKVTVASFVVEQK